MVIVVGQRRVGRFMPSEMVGSKCIDGPRSTSCIPIIAIVPVDVGLWHAVNGGVGMKSADGINGIVISRTPSSGIGLCSTAMLEGGIASMPSSNASSGTSSRALRPFGDPWAKAAAQVYEGLSARLLGSARTSCSEAACASGGKCTTADTEQDWHGISCPG